MASDSRGDHRHAQTTAVWLALAVSQQTFWVFGRRGRSPFVYLSFATDAFATPQNLFNVTRNFAFVGHHRARHDGGDHHRRASISRSARCCACRAWSPA